MKKVEAPVYPGAKAHLLIEDAFENREWNNGLMRLTTQALQARMVKPEKSKERRINRQKGKESRDES